MLNIPVAAAVLLLLQQTYLLDASYGGWGGRKIAIMNPGKLITSFKVPKNAQPGETMHVILGVKDS
ncbi:MAG: hypothetical protein WKF87_14575 [Chryseolinea sp.]